MEAAFSLSSLFHINNIEQFIQEIASFEVETMMSGINAIPTTKVSKRLKEQDATTIFRCLANNEPPPENLNFKIIRIPRNAMKMAPPSFEYEGEI